MDAVIADGLIKPISPSLLPISFIFRLTHSLFPPISFLVQLSEAVPNYIIMCISLIHIISITVFTIFPLIIILLLTVFTSLLLPLLEKQHREFYLLSFVFTTQNGFIIIMMTHGQTEYYISGYCVPRALLRWSYSWLVLLMQCNCHNCQDEHSQLILFL